MKSTPPIPMLKKRTPWRLWAWVAVTILACGVIIAAVVAWIQSQLSGTGMVSDVTPRQIIVGSETLRIPANKIRFADQRAAVTLNDVELVILWPSGDGYDENNVAAFHNTDGDSQLIFMTVGKRRMRHDMNDRLAPIYLKLFDGAPTEGPSGLTMQPLKRGVGYDDETLALYAENDAIWAARCQRDKPDTTATCLRDVHFGRNLSVRYRYPVQMLQDWRAIDALVLETVQSFLRAS